MNRQTEECEDVTPDDLDSSNRNSMKPENFINDNRKSESIKEKSNNKHKNYVLISNAQPKKEYKAKVVTVNLNIPRNDSSPPSKISKETSLPVST